MELFKDLILNLSVIIVLSFLSSLIYEKFYDKKRLHTILQIIVFAGITTFTVYNPVVIEKVFHFDGRTILTLISSLFFGWVAGLTTMIVSITTRLNFGYVNLYSTILSVLIPFLIGVIFNCLIRKKLFSITVIRLYLIALLNSIFIFLTLYLIQPIVLDRFLALQSVAIVVFPIITTLIGLVINNSINKIALLKKNTEDEARWKATFHSIDDGMIILSTDGIIKSVNEGFKKIFALDSNNLLNKSISETIKIKDFENDNDLIIDFSTEPNYYMFYNRPVYIEYNNTKIPGTLYLTDIISEEGEKSGYVLVIRDNRAELENQKKLLESEVTFRGIFNSIEEAIYIQDSDGRFIDVNDGAVKMYGYNKNDFIEKSPEFLSADYKNDNLDLKSIFNKAFQGEPQVFEFWGKKKDGTIFPKIVSLYSGEYFGRKVIIAVAVDISNLYFAQEKLIEHEQLLRTLINATPDIIYVKSGAGKWIEFNKGTLELLNVEESLIFDKNNTQIIDKVEPLTKKILYELEEIEDKAWLKKSIIRVEYKITFHNSFTRFFDLIIIPLFNDDQSRKNIIIIGRDITSRIKSEEEKQLMLNKLSTVIENFDSAVLFEDNSGKIEFANDNFIKLFKIKYSKDHIKSLNSNTLFDLIKGNIQNSDNFIAFINNCIKVKSLRTGFEFFTIDGQIIETNFYPVSYDKEVVNHLWIFRNITVAKTFEKKLKSQISELERFNKSMVERELRMIELKKEVNDLLLKAGFSPKYTIYE